MKREVFIIEDNYVDSVLLSSCLAEKYKVLEASSGEDGLSIIENEYKSISAVFLDLVMPGIDGFEVLRRINKNPLWQHIPVIITTSKEDSESLDEVLKLGAITYIQKPYDQKKLLRVLHNVISLCEKSAQSINDFRDKLTGLYNRETFFIEAEKLIKSHEPEYYILSYLNIEYFSIINEQYRQKTGDRVLLHISECLFEATIKFDGIAARINGDKFAILFPAKEINSEEIEYIHRKMTRLLFLNQQITIRVGRYFVKDLSIPVNVMYDRAILAEFSIQDQYDLHVAEYKDSMRTAMLDEQEIVSSMEKSLRNKEFKVWYQPQYNHATGGLIGAEALVRWIDSKDGHIVPPIKFIPVFEKNGFIYELDKYIWEEVCANLRKWLDEGIKVVPVSVNISRVDLFHDEFINVIQNLLTKYSIPIYLLRLEITESAFSEASDSVVESVKKLIEEGFTVEIDDFGSGYSSLNTLKNVPAQILKLDMKFFNNTDKSGRSGNIIESVVRMAKWIDMEVIAEGVEEQNQADYLKSIGCYYIQGYLYSKPVPLEEYEKIIRENKKEIKLFKSFTVKEIDNSKFWDPDSMDTLMFNSYIGGACIFEYRNKNIEFLRVNDRYKQVLGRFAPVDENLFNMDIQKYLFGKDREKFFDLIRKSIEDKTESSTNICLKESENDDENVEYIKITIRVIAISGNDHLFYCVIENYSNQKLIEKSKIEAELKEKRISKQLECIMDNSLNGITAVVVGKNAETDFIFINNRYYEILGYTKEQFEAEVKNGFDLILAEDRENVISQVQKLTEVGQSYKIEMRATRRNGEVICLRDTINTISMEGIAEPVQLSNFVDITNEKIIENQLIFANECSHDIIS